MPKIFKENKLALLVANLLAITVWIFFITTIKNIVSNDNLPFYLNKIADLLKILPPLLFSYYLKPQL